jgi:CHAT domain-containing protein/tetratricopeptide (TPR) repeat protein
LILLTLAATIRAQSPARPEGKSLPTETSEKSSIGGEQRYPYEFELNPNELFQVYVEQSGIDVLLRLLDSGGHEVAQMKSPSKLRSGETLTYVAAERESYKLEVSAVDAKAAPGEFTIRREPPREATALDRRRVEAERIFVEAMTARATDGQEQTAIRKFEESEAAWQELGDGPMTDLSRRLVIKSKAYVAFTTARALAGKDGPEAIKKFEEARGFFHEVGETSNEGAAVLGMNQAAVAMNDQKAAIEFLKRAAPLFAKPEERVTRSDILIEIAKYYLFTAKEDDTALEYFLLVYPLYTDPEQLRDSAVVAGTIGALYHKLGDHEKAYDYLHKALLLKDHLGDKCYELETLINLGKVSLDLGLKAEALRHLKDEAPLLYKGAGGCVAHKVAALINLGKTYYDLGDLEKARHNYTDALEASSDDGFKAILNNNLGAVHYDMGEYATSQDYYLKALSLYKDDVKAQATTLTNLGVVYAAQGKSQLAFEKFQEALRLRQGDRNGEASTLTSLSEGYLKSGDTAAALKSSNQALTLFGAVNDPNGEAAAFANAMDVSRATGKKRLAIFYGKLSVNKLQELRGAARGIGDELELNYLRDVKGAYQHLSELMVEEGMYEQAVQVLNLYRDQQFFDLNLEPKVMVKLARLSTVEAELAGRLETQSRELRRLALQLAETKKRVGDSQPADAEAANQRKLQAEFDAANEAFAATLGSVASQLDGRAGADDRNKSVDDVDELRTALGALGATPGQKAASLYTLAGDENFYVLLLTPSGVKAFSHPTKSPALSEKVKNLLAVLGCPKFDPFAESAMLYDIIFKSVSAEDGHTTLEAELEREKPDLLLWSLDERLAGVPVAALYDAGRRQFLVERYQQAVFTRVRPDRIAREPKSWLEGIGLGTSKAYTGYDALPGVRKSLYEIFGNEATRRAGILKGPVLLDERFKESALEGLNGRRPLVHIASHFAYYPGNAEESVLLLGDGSKLSLSKMEERKNLFAGVELLMLAACKTSVNQPDKVYGKEIDGFAEVAQRLGASSVVATLWNISDAAAPEMEVGFYRLHRGHQSWAKSELLRQTQLSMLRGSVGRTTAADARAAASAGGADTAEGCAPAPGTPRKPYTPNPKAPFAHPYYWAPFVLYGGSR